MGNEGVVHGDSTQRLLILEERLRTIYGWILGPANYREKIEDIELILDIIDALKQKIEIDEINREISNQQARYHMNELSIVEARVLGTISDREIDAEGVYIYNE